MLKAKVHAGGQIMSGIRNEFCGCVIATLWLPMYVGVKFGCR